jgi:hypothetical protein
VRDSGQPPGAAVTADLAALEGIDGFSYTHSWGSTAYTSPSGLWLQRLSRRGRMNSWTSHSQSGARMAHLAHRVHGYYSSSPLWTPARGLVVVIGSVNDMVTGGADPLAVAGYRHPLGSLLGMVTAGVDYRASGAAWSYPHGTWTAGTNACRVSQSTNAVADCAFQGTTCTVHLIGWPAGTPGGRALLRIDGEPVAEIPTGDAGPATMLPLGFTHLAVRLPGLEPGAHVLRVSNAGPAGSWLGVQNVTVEAAHPPTVLVCTEPLLDPDLQLWPLYGTAAHDAYTAATAAACLGLPGVTLADLQPGWRPELFHADGMHPNDVGHAHIADTLAAVLAAQGFREGQNRLRT